MGTNYVDCLKEAFRVLRSGGELKIAEVISRIPKIDDFVALVEALGFDLVSVDKSNTMFVMIDFRKSKKKKQTTVSLEQAAKVLQPCIYKRR